ncbi:MAG: PQQ-binding-like beta-propeller repeat protein, partial [Magnetococcus sp. WYHC-3]
MFAQPNLLHRWRAVVLLTMALGTTADAANWPGWRGDGSGVSEEQNLPLYWSAEAGVLWKTPLPGAGNSSPVVWGDRVFLTASTDAGTNRVVICLNRLDGQVVWRKDLPAERAPATSQKNGYASPTPVTDGAHVYVFFDSPGLVAMDMQGQVIWTRDLGPFKNSYNMASSPVLCGEVVIQCCDQDAGSFIAAFDKQTGLERWRTPRPKMSRQFATPLPMVVDGKPQVVVNGEAVIAYDPATGQELWSCRGMRPNVTPSAVTKGDLVYVTSGRNGPSMAIDPRGTGDITETHVRMQTFSGGPYVPSPLAFSAGLLLPGDDGKLRLIGNDGKTRSELRIPGHYTASPVASGSRVYWPNEKGQVAVVRISGDAANPRLEMVTVNDVGSACLASPAIADGKLFLRTEQALLCVNGTDKPVKAAAAELPDTLDELKKLFAEHPATDGPDATLRIAIVEKLGIQKDTASVPFLQDAALKDPQWDVGEAAAKSLADIGKPAVPALIALMSASDGQPYLKTVAADALGQLAVAEAVPALLKSAGSRNVLIRLPALQALGRIAAANPTEAGRIMPVLVAKLTDSEGTVRKTAIEALVLNAGAFVPGVERDAVVRKLTVATNDKHPLVALAATKALTLPQFQPPPQDAGATNAPSADIAPKSSVTRWLRAGPVQLKFQDGELRYLSVRGREIVRRVYFAVRDQRYDTVMPEFREIAVEAAADAFTIRLAATCSNAVAAFSWTGTIIGTADGRISFQVSGQAERDFKSPRVGLHVLYGAEALAGQTYEQIAVTGDVTSNIFPRLVSAKLLAENFRALRYTTADGLEVNVGLVDGKFSMEDQRNFGDSSYKAFSSMPFKYMVKKGQQGTQALTIEVKGAPAAAAALAAKPLRITLGETLPTARLPRVVAASSSTNVSFGELNGNPASYA